MTKLIEGSLIALVFAVAACAGDDETGEDTIGEAELDLIVSPQSVHSFFASSGYGVVIRVTDTAHTAFVPAFTVYDPAGNTVKSASGASVAGTSFQAAMTGTYSVRVYDAAHPQATGAIYAWYLAVAPGANKDGVLVAGGVKAGHIDEGELDSYTFTAASGEGIMLRATDVAGGALTPAFYVYGPAGNLISSASGANVAGEALPAPSTGTYTVVVFDWSSGLASTGDYKLYFIKAPGANQGGALSPGGVKLGTIEKGELDSYTFTAASGEGIMLRATDVAGGALTPAFYVYGPAGNLISSASGANVAGEALPAPSTGTYTVVVFDWSSGLASTGDYKLYYTRAPGANQGGALISGTAIVEHIDKGELDSYTFTAVSGNGIALSVTDIAAGALTPGFSVYGPTGNLVHSATGPIVASKSFTAASSGTYTLVVYDWSSGLASTGDYQLGYTRTP